MELLGVLLYGGAMTWRRAAPRMQARFDHVMTRINGRLFLTLLHITWDQHGAIVRIERLLVPLAFVIAKPINVVMFPIVPIISCSKLGTG